MASTWVSYFEWKQRDLVLSRCKKELCITNLVEGEPVVKYRAKAGVVVWHPECWLQDAVAALRNKQFEVIKLGRKAVAVSPEDKAQRIKILAQHSALEARIRGFVSRVEAGSTNKNLQLRIDRLRLLQDKLYYSVVELGGAPPSWRVPPLKLDKDIRKESDGGKFENQDSTGV